MENKDTTGEGVKELLVNIGESPSQIRKDTASFLRRETDSLDDFEHLEHDVSPIKEIVSSLKDDKLGFDNPVRSETPPRAGGEIVMQAINTGLESVAEVASKRTDQLMSEPTLELKNKYIDNSLVDSNLTNIMNTAADLLDMGDATKTEKTDELLSNLSYVPPVPPHAEPLKPAEIKGFGDSVFDGQKDSVQSFMDMEKEDVTLEPTKISTSVNDLADRFSDSEPEMDDFKPSSNEDFKFKPDYKSDDFLSSLTKTETFKDVIEDPEPVLPQRDYYMEPSPVREVPIHEPELTKPSEPIIESKPVSPPLPEPIIEKAPIVEPVKPKAEPKILPKKQVIEAEAMFCKMGLVESLIYWRDPKKSGAVFGGTLVVLLSLAYFSLISVFAYLSLLALVGTISFRIYKNVLQAVQKTADGHPFKELLEADLTLPQDKVKEISEIGVAHVNAALTELRRLFLVEDLVDSIKFGVLLWCLTYVGAWFNGMTIIIIAFVALFTLPKVYENNKTQIDANLDIVRTKLADITSKVKAAIPIGKKSEEKKEQ